MDPDARRRRGIQKLVIGVGLLVLVVVVTVVIAPMYYR
jgi:hypothetical protein